MNSHEREIATLRATLAHTEDELRRSREALEAARQLAAATERRRQTEQHAFHQLRIIRWTRLPRRFYQRLRSLAR